MPSRAGSAGAPTQPLFAPRLAERSTIDQYLLLSMLVHVLLIVALGDTTGSVSKQGQRSFGSLRLSLNGATDAREPVAANAAATSAGASGAATASAPRAAAAPLPVAQPAPAASPPPQTPAPDAATPEVPPVIAKPVTQISSEFVVPPPTPGKETAPPVEAGPRPAPLPTEPLAPVKVERSVATFVEAPSLPAPAPIQSAITPIEAPRVESRFAPPVVLTPRELPTLTPLPPLSAPAAAREMAPAPTLTPAPVIAPAPLETIPAPRIERNFAAPIEAKALAEPVVAPAPLAPLAPARIEREFAPPVELKANEVQVNTPPPLSNLPPARIEREMTPFADLAPPIRANPGAGGAAAREPLPGGAGVDSAAGVRNDQPGATNRGATPKIDLDAIRDRARSIAREGSGPRTVLPFYTAPKPPPKTPMQEAFDKALQRPDCKEAYAGMGLAAVVPLVRDAITEKGCKW